MKRRRVPHYSKTGKRLGRPRSDKPKILSSPTGRRVLRKILETDDKLVQRPWGGFTLLKGGKSVHKNVAAALIKRGLLVPTEEIPYVYRPSATAERELVLAEGTVDPLFKEE